MGSAGCIPVSHVQSEHTQAGRGLLVATHPGFCGESSNVRPQRSHVRVVGRSGGFFEGSM
jgi:hypothetical protein